MKNGDETDVDCGGSCAPCGTQQGCSAGTDCASGVCDGSNHCAAPSCDDQVKNGDETDVDCGGSACAPCNPRCGALHVNGTPSGNAIAPYAAALSPAGSFTVEAWVYPTVVASSYATIAAHYEEYASGTGSYTLQLTGGNNPYFEIESGGYGTAVWITGPSGIATGDWTHLAGVFDAAAKTMTLYVNGASAATTAVSFTHANAPTGVPFSMGTLSKTSSSAQAFTGYIDEVRLSSVARYAGAFTPAATFATDVSTVALFHFDELTGTVAHDASSTANDAALDSGAQLGGPPGCP